MYRSNFRWSECISDNSPVNNGSRIIGVLEGEGIGPEIVRMALDVLAAVEPLGSHRFEIRTGGNIGLAVEMVDGEALSTEVKDFCRCVFDEGGAIFAGAGGGRFVYDLRREFDLFCKIVPLKTITELSDINRIKKCYADKTDIVLIRENVSGIYMGTESRSEAPNQERRVEQSFCYSESDIRRILLVAGRIAQKRKRTMTIVIKDGGLPLLSNLWREIALEVSRQLDIECSFANIDYAAYLLVQHSSQLDVLVAPNLFADILADLGSVMLGSRGVSYSGNFSPQCHGVYQTNHGGAHDLVGTGRANPIGQIFALAMMLRESFGLLKEARLIEEAVAKVLQNGWRTEDICNGKRPPIGSEKMTELIVEAIENCDSMDFVA